MAQIQFRNGWTLENHPMATIVPLYRKEILVERLTEMAADWRQAAGGCPLADLKASVSLMLADFADLLELTPEVTEQILGEKA